MQLNILDEHLILLPEKALYLPDYHLLVVADLHLGKAAHFRKAGLPMPFGADKVDLQVIARLMRMYAVKEVLFLGDLFHSEFNSAWFEFQEYILEHVPVRVLLTQGNHDEIPDFIVENSEILSANKFIFGNILFSHHPLKHLPEQVLNIAGHLHPGIKINLLGRQSLKVPCFYLNEQQLVLPAFGSTTGLSLIKPQQQNKIMAILDKQIIAIN